MKPQKEYLLTYLVYNRNGETHELFSTKKKAMRRRRQLKPRAVKVFKRIR